MRTRTGWVALLMALEAGGVGIAACASDVDQSVVPTTDGGDNRDSQAASEAGLPDAPSDVGDGSEASADASSTSPQPGAFMGACRPPDAGACDDGLVCVQFQETSFDGGLKSCSEQICTRACDAGCQAPSMGCGKSNRCAPPSCLP